MRATRAFAEGACEGRTSPLVLEEVWHVVERVDPLDEQAIDRLLARA